MVTTPLPVAESRPAPAKTGPVAAFERHRADRAALLTVTIWGVSFVFQKAALEQFDVFAFTFLRFAGMLALGWGVLLWHQRADRDRAGASGRTGIRPTDLPGLALAGVLGYSLYIPLSTFGLSYTTAFSNALLIATAPLFSALLLAALRLERLGRWHLLGMLVSLVGVVLFLAEKIGPDRPAASPGDLISLVASFFFAAYGVASKPLLARHSVLLVTTWTLTIGVTPVLLFSWPALFSQDWTRVSPEGWAALAWTIVFPVYVAWSIWSWAIARLGVARTSAFMYLVPLVGGLTAWLLTGEAFGPLKLAGAALTLSGLALARRGSAAARLATPTPPARSGRAAPG